MTDVIDTRKEKLIYTARTHTTGGREGESRSDDGRLQVKLDLLQWALGVLLSFQLIELIGSQDPASWRAYSHVHKALLQEFPCLLQSRCGCGAAKLDAAKSILPADRVLP
jgi:hypothetical protein